MKTASTIILNNQQNGEVLLLYQAIWKLLVSIFIIINNMMTCFCYFSISENFYELVNYINSPFCLYLFTHTKGTLSMLFMNETYIYKMHSLFITTFISVQIVSHCSLSIHASMHLLSTFLTPFYSGCLSLFPRFTSAVPTFPP